MTADERVEMQRPDCNEAIKVRYTVRRCDLPAGHDGCHVTNDGEGRPEYYWRGGVMTRKTMWLVTVGAYSDYMVLAVAPTEAEAQRYADAYNSERESHYRDDAEVEEVDLYENGDPLPRRITLYNGEPSRTWPVTHITTDPASLVPHITKYPHGNAGLKPFAQNYPSPDAIRQALGEAAS